MTERFYRGHRDGHVEGIGLGLSIVDAIARLHGGTLTLSDASPGLVATLRLPRSEMDEVRPAAAVPLDTAL